MARKDALLRLHERLIAKRDTLRRKLTEDRQFQERPLGSVGDVGDAANDGVRNELSSQLQALESRELAQIERAIELIREGRYGRCEICNASIPIARLRALPYSLLCVECQRVQEEAGSDGFESEADWTAVYEHEGRMNDKEFTVGDIEREL
jgi:DnaK suppressor protein